MLLRRPAFVPAMIAAILLALLAAFIQVPAANAVVTNVSWIGGKDLYATSALMSQQMGSARVVYLTSGESGGDSLSVPPAARAQGAHVLMVRRDSVPSVIEAELRRLNPRWVHIVGSRSVLSDRLWSNVRRILPSATMYRAGTNSGDRVDSAIALASQLRQAKGSIRDVFIIGRNGYSDGLATGNVAARMGAAVFPAMGDPAVWARKIAPQLSGVQRVHFIGASSVLSDDYYRALDARTNATMSRIAGPDRYATNAQVVQRFVPSITGDRAFLVAGNGHGDTIGASVFAAELGSVMMLSGRYCHDHGLVPAQFDRLGVGAVTGIGTKFWITQDALRLRQCNSSPPSPIDTVAPAPTSANYGGLVELTFSLRNPSNFGVTATIRFDAQPALAGGSFSIGGGAWQQASTSSAAAIAAGASTSVRVRGSAAGPVGGGTFPVTLTVDGQAFRTDLTVRPAPATWQISASPATTVSPGERSSVSFTLENRGGIDGSTSLAVTVPPALSAATVRIDGSVPQAASAALNLTVPAGAAKLVVVEFDAGGPATGGTYQVRAAAGGRAAAAAVTVLAAPANLSVTAPATASVPYGAQVEQVFIVRNTGGEAASASLRIEIDFDIQEQTVSLPGRILHGQWWQSVSVAAGEELRIVVGGVAGGSVLGGTLRSEAFLDGIGTAATTAVLPAPAQLSVRTATATSVEYGGQFRLSFTIANHGGVATTQQLTIASPAELFELEVYANGSSAPYRGEIGITVPAAGFAHIQVTGRATGSQSGGTASVAVQIGGATGTGSVAIQPHVAPAAPPGALSPTRIADSASFSPLQAEAGSRYGVFGSWQVRGSGSAYVVLPPAARHALLTASSSGGRFVVSQVSSTLTNRGGLIANSTAAYHGSVVHDNRFVFNPFLHVEATGDWTITLRDMRHVPPLTQAGSGDTVGLWSGADSWATLSTEVGNSRLEFDAIYDPLTSGYDYGSASEPPRLRFVDAPLVVTVDVSESTSNRWILTVAP
ncbi:cell wall-binding repeat-containing protein [Agrococcus terreus]|uniref:Cell wall binding repeat 2 n=1 Tax=Agrococcus terreus TaxID=574649 RepID=A0ABQ2KDW6_9MICO|nr:cell wall-binding repeat-containing protein [Agrococcus terreus]GGN77912.1 hypothetical protein GCM10010968_03070 [Agrococcus terreus]